MKKLAIFVEGQTEQIFAQTLLEHIAGQNNITIEKRKAKGGAQFRRRISLIEAISSTADKHYWVMIADCGTDNRVGSDIRDNYDRLVAEGYEAIIGIRDVFPECKRELIPAMRQRLKYKLKTKPVDVTFVLAVMEIEAWFLAEHTHFERLSAELTPQRVKAAVGFDPAIDDVELRDNPAADLHRIYSLAGLAYHKTKDHVQRTTGKLDYARLYLELPSRVASLAVLTRSIDTFLAT